MIQDYFLFSYSIYEAFVIFVQVNFIKAQYFLKCKNFFIKIFIKFLFNTNNKTQLHLSNWECKIMISE